MTNESMQIRATRVRQMWMRNMGISERDIQYYIECDPPTSVAEERAQLYASWRINKREPTVAETPLDECSTPQTEMSALDVLGIAMAAVLGVCLIAAVLGLCVMIWAGVLSTKFDSSRMDRACKQAEAAAGVKYAMPATIHRPALD